MNFLFLGIFFRIFLNLFRFLNDKNELKGAKSGLILRGTHVDATWHEKPHGSATRAHAARYLSTYIYIVYNI